MENKIYELLNKIQTELKVPKSQFNKFGKYKYRSCEDILESIKPLLSKTKLTMTISDDIVNFNNRFYIKSIVKLSNGENEVSCAGFAREEESKKGMDGSQITGAASSYARKYALCGLFCIDDNKDSDSTNTHGESEEPIKVKKIPDDIKEKISKITNFEELKKYCNSLVKESGKDYKQSITECFNEQKNKIQNT